MSVEVVDEALNSPMAGTRGEEGRKRSWEMKSVGCSWLK